MINISKKALERLEGAIEPNQGRLLRVFIKGLG